ncbi:hypothetical protein GGR58DRAFT_510412 [Xylaria digitata]|nr:hypothetical protein GGR58DRAFT_510412 [Xylaria digitata]
MATRGPSIYTTQSLHSAWWWWEIGSCTLSIVSMGLVVYLLCQINGLAFHKWPFPIQPNSLLSVLTTEGKTSMLVPIASCISQLKWYHFSIRERRLTHLELFDNASQAVTAFALACVTIIALGIEPSTQQITHVLSREAPLNNVTSSIGRADLYQS